MRYISLCSGVEAASLAWLPLGWEPVAYAEVDDFPSAVLAARFPETPNLGDCTKVDWSKYRGAVDLVVGGTPCFVAGTLVLCEDGFKPIEEVHVGERVVTHKGNLKRVLATGSKVADTIMVKGQGSVGIECTPNHPFFSRAKRKVWDNSKREYKMMVEPDAIWTDAKDMQGRFWLNVCNVETANIPPLGKYGRGGRGSGRIEEFDFTSDFFYFVGRWLGDGWANIHKRKDRINSLMKRVYVCCSHSEADELEERLSATGLHFGRMDNGSTERFTCASTQLYDWLVGNFGVHADGKNIPAWCFGMDEQFRASMLNGYLDADGTIAANGYKSTTINRKLALGIKFLAGSCGLTTSVTYVTNERDALIEGRHVNERPCYISTHYKNPRSAFFADSGFYGRVKRVTDGRRNVTVYNLEVEDDHSYTTDGIAVHNCQAFSIAGKRGGLLDERGRLMLEFVRAVREIRPRYVLWENVVGSLSQDRGRAFGTLVRELVECGYSCAHRVIDAQFARVPVRDGDGRITGWFGPVAQRRRRVFLVAVPGEHAGRAAAILAFPEGVRGDHQTSAQKRESLAAEAAGGAGASGGDGCLTPWDVQSRRIHTPDGTWPALYAGEGGGHGYVANDESIGAQVEQSPTITNQGKPPAVAFAQNQRDEVRLIGGDGSISASLNAQHWGTHKNETLIAEPVVMASGQSNAEIGQGGVAPTIAARNFKDPPILFEEPRATERTSSRPSVRRTEASSS